MTDPRREADRWWRQASADLAFLPVARDAGKFDTCCFLAQQTAEKALKAYLFAQGERRFAWPAWFTNSWAAAWPLPPAPSDRDTGCHPAQG